MKDIVAFYSTIGPSLQQCVSGMNTVFAVKAFLVSTGKKTNLETASKFSYKKLGLTSALMEKSAKLLQDYREILKHNTGLQDRINRYGPIFNTFLEKYSAP